MVFAFLFTGFAILAGMFPFHTWAPTGHVAAPTAASMLLAGVVMKLGAYGCLRVAIPLFPAGFVFWQPVIMALAVAGILYAGFIALVQDDFKFVIGYSSVSHMGFVLLGLAAANATAVSGAVLQMFSHGVIAGLLFAVVGRMVYERTHTRKLADLRQLPLHKLLPFAAVVFVIAGLASMGMPGFSGFPAELTILIGVWKTSPAWAIFAGGGVLVETAAGKYHARRVVVTVSTGVLAARRIAFAPELPEWKWEAIRGLPMGLLNKIIFRFDDDILPHEADSEWVLHQQSPPPETGEPEVMAFVVKPLGSKLIVGFFGGTQAARFEKLGDKAAADYAKAALTQMYGPELVARIRNDQTKATHWGQNPWTLGAYSAALPGASRMHEELAKPVDDLVFFAGEAAGPVEYNGSLASAYISGLQASRAVQASLAGTTIVVAPKSEAMATR